MLTIVASSAIISCARAMTASAIQRRSTGRCVGSSANCCRVVMTAPPGELARQQPDADGEDDNCDRRKPRWLERHEERDAQHDRRPDPEGRQQNRIAKSAP